MKITVHTENSLYSGRCGKGVGSCKKDECCSKYGWCGKSDKHCKIEEGCQSKFGKCNSNTDDTSKSNDKEVSKNGRCGKGVGSCKKGECCSKYGWCGKSDKHCKIEEGCQSEFGKCKSATTITTTSTKPNTSTQTPSSGKCGKGYGSCKKGECCSKYGWCGKSDKHCKIEEGCQSEFGKCIPTTTTIITTSTKPNTSTQTPSNGKCGKGYGSCKKGECCSKYGWCGTTDDYCGNGCQSEFGKCKSTTTITTTSTKPNISTQTPSNGKCGKEYGSCKKGECCSKYGWCGTTNDYCGNGCQSEFGVCHNKNDSTTSNPTPTNTTSSNPTPDIPTPVDPVNNSTDISNPDFDYLFLKLENNKKNMLYSPLSIRYGLNMLKKGAKGNTYDEINKLIGNTELPKYKSIDKYLSLANGIFIRDMYYEYVKQSYINTLKEKYDAEIIQDEFKDAQNANKWIENKTLGIIKKMLKDEIVQNSEMIIINALAIDMEWYYHFDCDETYGGTFYLDDGQEMKATMMSNDEIKSNYISYYIDDDITVLTMSLKNYNGTQLEFMAIMPDKNLNTFIENVSKEQITQIDKKLKLSSDEKDGVNIIIPKFKFNYDLKLKGDLMNLGINDAFNYTADFSKMTEEELYVSEALHKADIEFSEDGIKAAAVTVFAMGDLDGPPDEEEKHPINIIIDKPFMFVIRDRETKDIWFTGTVYKPNSWENDKKKYEPIDDY